MRLCVVACQCCMISVNRMITVADKLLYASIVTSGNICQYAVVVLPMLSQSVLRSGNRSFTSAGMLLLDTHSPLFEASGMQLKQFQSESGHRFKSAFGSHFLSMMCATTCDSVQEPVCFSTVQLKQIIRYATLWKSHSSGQKLYSGQISFP